VPIAGEGGGLAEAHRGLEQPCEPGRSGNPFKKVEKRSASRAIRGGGGVGAFNEKKNEAPLKSRNALSGRALQTRSAKAIGASICLGAENKEKAAC